MPPEDPTGEPEATADPSPGIPLVASIAGSGAVAMGVAGAGRQARGESTTLVPAGPGAAGLIDAISASRRTGPPGCCDPRRPRPS